MLESARRIDRSVPFPLLRVWIGVSSRRRRVFVAVYACGCGSVTPKEGGREEPFAFVRRGFLTSI